METKKYTSHIYFSISTILFILGAIRLVQDIIMHPSDTLSIIVISLLTASFLIVAIQCGLAWHSYVEISDEGVKMKECAKRISSNKKENVDDIFIPWGDIKEVKRGPSLVLKTGEKIKLTQIKVMDANYETFQSAFEQYKFKLLKNSSN